MLLAGRSATWSAVAAATIVTHTRLDARTLNAIGERCTLAKCDAQQTRRYPAAKPIPAPLKPAQRSVAKYRRAPQKIKSKSGVLHKEATGPINASVSTGHLSDRPAEFP
jgi:hypothetical protein